MDEFDVEILDDGSIKIDTGRFSGPVHAQAEGFIRAVALGMGGVVTRIRRAMAGAMQHHAHKERDGSNGR